MKLKLPLLLIVVCYLAISQCLKSKHERCLEIQKENPDLGISCDHLLNQPRFKQNGETFLQKKISNYLQEMKEIYSNYMNNNENKIFINSLGEKIQMLTKNKQKGEKKEFLPNQQRFLQKNSQFHDFDYSGLVNVDKDKIVQDFSKALNSPKLHEEIHRQAKYLSNPMNKNILTNSENLLAEETERGINDPIVRDEGTKLYNAIREFSNTHKDDFKDSRFLSVTGESIEDPSDYVKREVSYMEGKHLNDAIVDKDMSMKDLDKMLEADKYLIK